MTFKLWADEAMTTEYGMAYTTSSRLQQVSFTEHGQSQRGVMYFGSPDATIKLENRAAPSTGDIILSVVDVLPEREDGATVAEGAVFQPAGGNGHVYRVQQGGILAASAPPYSAQTGEVFVDGTAQIVCLGQRHQPAAIKLALSESDLTSANGGAALTLGKTLNGGAAVAVHFEIGNAVSAYYDTLSSPMLSLELNDCVVLAV